MMVGSDQSASEHAELAFGAIGSYVIPSHIRLGVMRALVLRNVFPSVGVDPAFVRMQAGAFHME
jgi:hypothetical protein